MTLSLYKIKP